MENILQDQPSCHVLYKLVSKLDTKTTPCGMMPNMFWIGQGKLWGMVSEQCRVGHQTILRPPSPTRTDMLT